MERSPRRLHSISFLLFTIIVFVSGNSITNEKREIFSQGKFHKRESEGKNCYEGDGSSYRGTATRTEGGASCLTWSQSSHTNKRTHPGKDLRSNYCRNPDNDVKPWCWINHAYTVYEYCNVPKCSEVTTTFVLKCKAGRFYCSRQKKCISEIFRCDNEQDCKYGEDEVGCLYSLNNFKKLRGSSLRLYDDRQSYASQAYIRMSNEGCAKKCAEHTQFKCKSFMYRPVLRTCYLSKWNLNSGVGQIVSSRRYDYYELKQETTYTVKLVGGRDASEGNVEIVINNIKYRVCDDNWDNKDATVICRMLGYSGGVATHNSKFGSDFIIDIILDEVNCHGTETELNQCQAVVGTDKHNCGFSELAGAVCNKAPAKPVRTVTPTTGVTTIQTDVTDDTNSVSICGTRPYDQILLSHPADTENPKLRTFISKAGRMMKISNGMVVEYGELPWQVRIHRGVLSSPGSTHCGATIISEFWILSAAHCFSGSHKYWFTMIIGDYDIRREDLGEKTFAVEEIIPHKYYDYDTDDYDIALIKIKPTNDGRGIKFNDYVQPACLPDSRTPLVEHTMCLISGWGNDTTSVFPDILIAGEVPIINQELCERLHSKGIQQEISPRMFCAGYLHAGYVDSCAGDSGGPVVCKIAGTYTLLGITSWGRGCALANKPGVYTRVSSFVSWIEEIIRLYSRNKAERTLPRWP